MLNDSQKTEWWLLIKNVIYMIENKKDVEYSAIIVDEAQDFGMPEYRLLRSLVREKENDLFEFKVVFLIGINDDMLPYKKHIENLKHEKEIEAFIQQEKSLLYVAITRARDLVYVLSSKNRSELV
jgi:superfamily I DNA/RNA helicase